MVREDKILLKERSALLSNNHVVPYVDNTLSFAYRRAHVHVRIHIIHISGLMMFSIIIIFAGRSFLRTQFA